MQTVSVGITKIQRINTQKLKELKDILLVEEFDGRPLVAVIPYDYYMEMQSRVIHASDLIEKLENEIERARVTMKESLNA